MPFTSWEFARFFAVVLAGLWLARTRTLRQLVVLVAGAIFYARENPWYLLLLATPIVVDYGCALRIAARSDQVGRRRWLAVSVATDLGLLAYFKCAGFFVANVTALTGLPLRPLTIVLPLGISFFTLKSLSYTIDVYRGVLAPCHSPWRYAMFVGYFPDLIAGPIVRASVFLPQLARSLRPSRQRAWVGGQMILLGLTKKLVIADQLAPFADAVFTRPSEFSPLSVASGVLAYSLQIYCDFSGYSDMAIGLSHVIGFDLPENFNMPYLARSPTEFWRRWHITLSQWLRDYLYIPLGGNRRGRARTYWNLVVTMLLGGLWHGASWTFVVWGLWHAAGLVGHKLWLERTGGRFRPFGGVGGWLGTFLFVTLGWVFFRSPSLERAGAMFGKLVDLDPGGVAWFYSPIALLAVIVVAAHVVGILAARAASPRRRLGPFTVCAQETAGIYLLLPARGFVAGFGLTAWVIVILVFAVIKSSPFIYFQF